MNNTGWNNLSILMVFLMVSITSAIHAQCPKVYDFQGAPSSSPYWYSCTGSNFSFNLQSPDNWGAYTVDWGDGNTSNGASWTSPAIINHVYPATVDTFIVTITEVPSGCVIHGVVVMEKATSASIQIPIGGLTQSCAPQMMEFINSSTNVSETTVFTWDFGDGSPPLTFDHTNWHQTIPHVYEVGTVDCETEVSLTAQNYCNIIQGGSSTATFNPIRIWDLDDPGISASATLLCYPDTTVTFTNTTERNCYFQGNIYQRYERWNFGDYWNLGHDSIIDWTPWPPTFPHTMHYPGIGTYEVQLQDSNYCGVAETAISIQIVPAPVANISVSADTVCLGQSFTFFQHATGGPNSYSWNFGNGSGWLPTGSGNITYNFNQPGTYLVRSRVAVSGSSSACADTAAVQVVVLPAPTVALSADNMDGCDSLIVDYNAVTTGASSWVWTFDVSPNTYSGSDPPVISYYTPGNHQTTLAVSSPNGCTASKNITVEVHKSPVAAFSIFNLCEGDPAQFTDLTVSLPSDPITSWNWDFGDGTTSSQQNPVHLYTSSGDFAITLEVSNEFCSDTAVSSVSVEAVAMADISVDEISGCSPLSVQFSNATVGASGYLWTYGDGTTSIEFAPSHVFYNTTSDDSTFMITMKAFNAFGCANADTLYVQVLAGAVASFTGNGNPPGCSPVAADFHNNSQNADSYLWNFGDGTTSAVQHPTHIFNNTTGFLQSFDVTLYAYADNGCNDTISSPVLVFPLADFDFSLSSDEGCAPLTMTMPFISGVQTYSWNFGDGSTSTLAIPTHTFNNNSAENISYTISFTGISPFGCVDTASAVIEVSPEPKALFSVDTASGCSPLTVNLSNLSSAGTTFSWSYGDGQSSTTNSQLHSHVFMNNSTLTKTYSITLTATNASGCFNQFMIPVQVYPGVTADFQNPGPLCSPANVVFENTSLNGNTYDWQFDNGLQSSEQNPGAYFVNDGTAPVTISATLAVTSAQGCSDTTSHSFNVNPKPHAQFALATGATCEPAPAIIVNQSALATSYFWHYGDGTNSTISAAEHSHVFQAPDNSAANYTILLTAYSAQGCSDTTSGYFTLYPEVTAAFTSDTVGCSPFPVEFFNQSVGGTSYDWQFGDGAFSSENNPDHTYSAGNTNDAVYTAILAVENNFGCKDTAQQDIYVNHTPVAVAQLDSTSGCYPLYATFYNESIGADSYQWVYGTGQSDTTSAQYHTHTFFNFSEQPVNYPVTLNAYTDKGCSSSDHLSVLVSPQLSAFFNVNDEGCTPLVAHFDNNSHGEVSYEWDFGDGDSSTEAEPVHTFFNWGSSDTTYTVTLTVYNSFGCSDTSHVTVHVFPVPVASFNVTPSSQVWPSSVVHLVNTTIGGQLNFSWNMGDGTTLYSSAPGNYTYGTWGEYSIRLIANNSSCSDTSFHSITILPPNPIADFEGPAEGCAPLTVQFTNHSEYALNSNWLFGDGGAANTTNPVYTYWMPGTYTVTLNVEGYGDGTDQIVKEQIINVYPRAIAAFIVTPNEISVPGQPVHCLNISENASEYQWDFGNGDHSNETNPIYYYEEEGIYSVMLVANNEFNCPDTMLFVDAIYAKAGGKISFPNAFTPNTGGSNGGSYDPIAYENDVFFPIHEGVDDFQLQIFNKWGELLFESKDVHKGWDGYYRGLLCKQDVYVWKVTARFIDGQEYVNSGDVTLLIR